jgi:hypothetical protein
MADASISVKRTDINRNVLAVHVGNTFTCIYLYSDNHVLWAWNTKAVPMNYLDTNAVPKRKFFSANPIKEAIFLWLIRQSLKMKTYEARY